MSRRERSCCSGAVFGALRGSSASLESSYWTMISGFVVRIGVVGLDFLGPSSMRIDRVRVRKPPNLVLDFLPCDGSVEAAAMLLSDCATDPTGRRERFCSWTWRPGMK